MKWTYITRAMKQGINETSITLGMGYELERVSEKFPFRSE